MFFSDDLLTSKKGSFGIIWLMATLGPNNKKITRKQLTAVDLSKTCELIAEPPEPMALRLSGSLLVGVARVYNKSYDHFYSDVSNFHSTLRRSIVTDFTTLGKGAGGTMTLDLQGGGKSRYDQITFSDEMLDFDTDLDHEFRHIDWNNPFGHGGKRRSSSKLSSLATHSEQEEDEESSEEESEEDDGSHHGRQKNATASPFLPGYGSNTKTRMSTHHPSDRISPGLFGATDIPFEGEIDLGLNLDDLGAARDDSFSGPSGRGFDTPGGGAADFNMSDAFVGVDVYQGELQLGSRQGTPGLEGRITSHADVGSPIRSALKKRKDGSETGSLDGVEQELEAPKKKVKKAKTVTFDKDTELNDDEDRQARKRYQETMDEERKNAQLRRQEKIIDEQAIKLIDSMGGMQFFNPVMNGLFSTFTRVDQFKWEQDIAARRQGKQGVEPLEGDKDRVERSHVDREYDPFANADNPVVGFGDGTQGIDSGFQDFYQDYEMPIHEWNDPEVARRASQGSQNRLPWENRPRSATPGFDAGVDTSFSPASLRLSIMTPQEIKIRGRSRTGSMAGSGGLTRGRYRSSSLASDRPDDDPLLLAQGDGLDLPPDEDNADLSLGPLPPSQQARLQDLPDAFRPEMLATLEKQCREFLTYTEKKMIAFDTDHLHFDDLAPLESSKHIAALAFYDCLTLATKKIFSVQQDESWGPIDIRFAVESH